VAERRVAPEKVHDYWVRQWEHRSDYYRNENDLYGRLIAFSLDMEHYRRNHGFQADSRRIQPKGQQLYNLIRHKAALLSTPPINIEARPVQPVADADAAIIARRVIETKLENPMTRYKLVRHRMVLSALGGGRGTVAIEYDRMAGGVVLRNTDPRFLMHTPGFLDMHDPRTPDVIEIVPMRLSAVRRKRASGWSVPADLRADNWKPDHPSGVAQDSHWVELDSEGPNNPSADVGDGTDDDGIVTILKCYSRRDPFSETRAASVPRELPQEQWFWTDDAGQRIPLLEAPNPPFPGARLVTTAEDERQLEMYPDGYLCIIAPFYQGKKPLWTGSWLPDAVNTDVRLRSFPFMDMPGYLHPLRRTGLCDTQLNVTMQQIDNMSFRAAWEQMRMAQLIGVVPFGKLFKSDGRTAFELSDDPIQMAYAMDRLSMEGISWTQAPGMNSALPQFRQMLDRQWSYIGTGDIAMPAERSRDIPVGTIEAMQRTGDLPVQMHRDIMQAEESIAFGVILDYERAYRSDKELVQWVTDSGELASAYVSGSDLVDANVIITASPDWRALDSDRIQAVAQFVGQMAGMPQLMSAMAPLAGIPPEGVRNIQRAVAQMQMQQQMAAMQQAAPGQTAPQPVTQPS
jgi:hypothetical protein